MRSIGTVLRSTRREWWKGLGALASVAALAPCAALAAPGPSAALTLEPHELRLDNGLRAYVIPDRSSPAVAIHSSYRVGARDEAPGQTGFAHLFEHMMFQGTRRLERNEIARLVEQAGGQLNAGTGLDLTFYWHEVPSHHLERVLWAEAERLSSLRIDEEGLAIQRAAVRSEFDKLASQPYHDANEALWRELFAGTSYDHPPIGAMADVDRAEVGDLRAFFERHYRVDNLVLVLAGDVTPADARELVTRYLGDPPPDAPLPARPRGARATPARLDRALEDATARLCELALAWSTVGESHADHFALEAAVAILCGGRSSRLARAVVERAEAATSVSGRRYAYGEAGGVILRAQAATPLDAERVEAAVREAIAELARGGPTPQELRRFASRKRVEAAIELASNSGRARAVAVGATVFDDPLRILHEVEAYAALTASDVARVAARYFGDERIRYALAPRRAPQRAGEGAR